MILDPILIGVFATHAGLLLIYLFLRLFFRNYSLRIEEYVPIFFLPVAGPLMALMIDRLMVLDKAGHKPVDMEELHLGADIYWKSIKKPDENKDVVPLEEAIAIDDFKIRRKILLDSLFQDPKRYLSVLMAARYNDDVETTHYATSTISKIQRDYQLSISELEARYKKRPSHNTLLAYISVLQEYIETGLLEESLLLKQRGKFADLLKLQLMEDPTNFGAYISALHNLLALNDQEEAKGLVEMLITKWPSNENTWIEALKYANHFGDHQMYEQVEKVINGDRNSVDWTREGTHAVEPWLVHDQTTKLHPEGSR